MISVTVCSPDDDLIAPWNDLVARAPANVFMSPVALKVARDLNYADVRVLAAWDDSATPRRLVGLWALQVKRRAPLMPSIALALPYTYAFLSSPVIDPAFTAAVVPAFLATIRGNRTLPNVVALNDMDGESPAFAAMAQEVAGRRQGYVQMGGTARPVVTREFGVKASGSTRKKLRQDWNRLNAEGKVEILNARDAEGVGQAFEIFLTMEAASWKGGNGTALLCDAADAAFVRRLVGSLAENQAASVALLCLDGRPIAVQVLLYCGTTAFTWKTAFDAEYARFSPGALLVDKITELLLAEDVTAIDSCSVEEGFMGKLWAGRRTMVDAIVNLGPRWSPAFLIELARWWGYERLRNLRNDLRARDWLSSPQKRKAGG